MVGSWWTVDTWPGCCRSPTSHGRSKLAETRPRHLHPGRHEHEMTSTGATETKRTEMSTSLGPLKQVDAGVLNVGYAEAGPADGPPCCSCTAGRTTSTATPRLRPCS